MRSGWPFSVFISRKISPTRLNGPITRETCINFSIKDLKPQNNSSSQQLSPPLRQIILIMSFEESSTNLLADLLDAFILVLDLMCIFFLIFFFWMYGQPTNIGLVRPCVFSVKQQTQFESLVSFVKNISYCISKISIKLLISN